jgi:Ca2+-binding RTX toxin-like protein
VRGDVAEIGNAVSIARNAIAIVADGENGIEPMILGGEANVVSGTSSAILSGEGDVIQGGANVIVGGTGNTLQGNVNVLLGGLENTGSAGAEFAVAQAA